MEKASEVLLAARALIEREENWCQGDWFVGQSMCVMGACRTVLGESWSDFAMYTRFLTLSMGTEAIAEWNDSHTHAEVLAAFNRAIGLALDAEQHALHADLARSLSESAPKPEPVHA